MRQKFLMGIVIAVPAARRGVFLAKKEGLELQGLYVAIAKRDVPLPAMHGSGGFIHVREAATKGGLVFKAGALSVKRGSKPRLANPSVHTPLSERLPQCG